MMSGVLLRAHHTFSVSLFYLFRLLLDICVFVCVFARL